MADKDFIIKYINRKL